MTREEAIIWLQAVKHHRTFLILNADEAIDMAISALKNEEWYMTFFNNITESPNDADEKNDEVIEHDREWIIGCIKHDGFIKTDRFDKANQIILDALEPQTDTDLISRADLLWEIEQLKQSPWYNDDTNHSKVTRIDAVSVIENLCIKRMPSVSAERVGEWQVRVDGDMNGLEWYVYGCSQCNEEYIHPTNYCPNCGAKMKGGTE